jgi:hypothetical protein
VSRLFSFVLPAPRSPLPATGDGLVPAGPVQQPQLPPMLRRRLSCCSDSRSLQHHGRECDTDGRLHLFPNPIVTRCRVR